MTCEAAWTKRHRQPSEYHGKSSFVVLLDITVNDYRPLKAAISLLNDHRILWMTDFDECLDFLTSPDQCPSEVCLIISHLYINITQDILCDLIPQIKRVYIIEPPNEFDVTLIESKKLRGPFRDVCLLIKTFISDYQQADRRSTYNLLQDPEEYVRHQFLYNVLMRISNDSDALSEYCEKIRNEIRLSEVSVEEKFRTLLEVEQFEQTYHPTRVIEEYTKDSFFHRHLNKFLRESGERLDIIFACRSVLCDLFHSLNHRKVKSYIPTPLYRGQQADLDEIIDWKNNIGSVFAFRSFLSATYAVNIAQIFAGAQHNHNDPRNQSVIFIISIDEGIFNTLDADTGMNSEEEEHLFSSGSLFRIDGVQHLKKVWYIYVTLVNQDYILVRQIIDPWKNIIGDHFLSPIVYERPVLYYTQFGFRALLYVVQLCDRTEMARNEMIKLMCEYYGTETSDMNIIAISESSYLANEAITSFTDNECLYNLLTESLKNHDVNKIFKLRYFIIDFFAQFNRLRQEQSIWYEGFEGTSVFLYYAEVIDNTTMEEFCREYLLHRTQKMFRQFFTATTSIYEAGKRIGIDFERKYARYKPWIPPDRDKAFVLFTLEVLIKNTKLVPWVYYHDRERSINILFSPGLLFNVDSIDCKGDANNLWYLNMSLCQDDEEEFLKLFNIQI